MRNLSLAVAIVAAPAFAACAPTVRTYDNSGGSGGGSSSESSASSSSRAASSSSAQSSSSGGGTRTAYLPVAPGPGNFMWQGVQDQFVAQDMMPCNARVTIAAGDQAVCFVGANGNVHCAGKLYTMDFGSTFVDTGISGVEQILMSPTFNSADHNSICVTVTNGGGLCFGGDNDQGEFGDGNKNAAATPVHWGTDPTIFRLATGTWDSICGMSQSGGVFCAGYGFDVNPVAEGGGHTNFFIDTFGALNLDSTTVLRVPNSRAECKIGMDGYECGGTTPYGTQGAVVDGTVQGADPMQGRACWLDTSGKVTCTPWTPGPPGTPFFASMFTDMPVLAIAENFYKEGLCAVYNDGSIACQGKNDQGQLGTGDTSYVAMPKVVAPPGTIDVTCK